ncbi:hypothetical protein L964_1886 [Leuconostoc pseudomesenteroides 1159]|nr:hypothetical protein L964_1886 [Leuconostoc pseudomesenteroides 1159]
MNFGFQFWFSVFNFGFEFSILNLVIRFHAVVMFAQHL